jgi:hypothetical protein
MNQKIIIAVVAAVVLIGGVYLYTNNRKAVAPETNTNVAINPETNLPEGDVPNDSPESNPTIPTTDTIAVSTQLAGDSVTIDNVFLSQPGFITIHEVTSKGQAGNIIGTSGLLGVGPKQDLDIRAMLNAGAKYIAMVRVDNGDKKFNAQQDVAVVKDGAPLMIMFSVSQ